MYELLEGVLQNSVTSVALGIDFAMNSKNSNLLLKKGGIDFDPAQMSLEVKQGAEEFHFKMNGKAINPADIQGAEFTIRSMTQVIDVMKLLQL